MASEEPRLEKTYQVNYQDEDKLGSSNDFQNSFHCTFVQPLPFLKKISKSTVFSKKAKKLGSYWLIFNLQAVFAIGNSIYFICKIEQRRDNKLLLNYYILSFNTLDFYKE